MNEDEKNLLMLCAVEYAKREDYPAALKVIGQILADDPDDYQALFNQAFTLQMAGDTDEAEEILNRLQDLVPGSPGVHFRLAQLLKGKGVLEKSLAHFTRVTELQPFSAESWHELGSLFLTLGQYDEALEAFHQGSVFIPDDNTLWIQLGVCHLRKKNYDEAIRCFDHALELVPGSEQALYNKARIYETIGEREKEITCYDDIIRYHPENLFAWLKKSLVLMLAGDYDWSMSCLNVASRLDNAGHMPFLLKGLISVIRDQNEDAIVWFQKAHSLLPDDTDILLHLAKALGSNGQNEEALAVFDKILEKNPGCIDACEGKARALYHLQRWDDVCRICRQCRQDEPKNPVFYLLEARVRGWHTGEPGTASTIILDGLFHNPSDENLACLLADLYVFTHEPESAISLLRREVGMHPDSIPLLYRLGTLMAKQGDYDSASEYYTAILRIQPDDSKTLYLAGEINELRGDPETALKQYTAVITSDPLSPAGWLGRARTLLEQGNPDDSLRSATQAVLLSDEMIEAWFCKGNAELQAGMPEEARKTFTYITLTWPENPEGWLSLGDVMYLLEEWHAAGIAYSHSLELNATDVQARNGIINSLIAAGNFDGALSEYNKSLEIHGDNFEDLIGKAIVLIKTSQRGEAEVCLHQSELHIVQNAGCFSRLAQAWALLDEYSRSDQYYLQSLDYDPENGDVWRMRGDVLHMAGHHEQALGCYNRALELNPDDHAAYVGKTGCLTEIRG